MIVSKKLTWEQAVVWLRQQPDQQALVAACYYDDPLTAAAQRFYESAEWQATTQVLPPTPAWALDLGAGRGISSYALSRTGWQVVALEPDASAVVGARAIQHLGRETSAPIFPVQTYAETIPFAADSFALVYARQILHHAQNLAHLCDEVYRVLKPGGTFVAIREHVISRPADLSVFLRKHPLHHLYGGEAAYLLNEYTSAIKASGLKIIKTLHPLESAINYFPLTNDEWLEICRRPLSRWLGARLAQKLTDSSTTLGRWLLKRLAFYASLRDNSAGRLYSFVAVKP